jgi:hypothetical protein
VYHAASAASYPQRAPPFFDMLHNFWTHNPPPFQLPLARYTIHGACVLLVCCCPCVCAAQNSMGTAKRFSQQIYKPTKRLTPGRGCCTHTQHHTHCAPCGRPVTPRRYPVFSGRHCPTPKSVQQGTRATRAKVWLAAKLLQLTGQGRKARSLVFGFKAFCVQNDPRWGRTAFTGHRLDETQLGPGYIYFLEMFSYKWILSPLGGTLHNI